MSKISEAVALLSQKFQQAVPIVGSAKKARLSGTKLQKGLENFYATARDIRKTNRFWVIGWARVALGLKQELLRSGYPPELVSKVIMSMLFNTAKAR